jgi:hypothetical protein
MLSLLRSLKQRLGKRSGGTGERASAPDWSKVDDYSALYRLVPKAHFADHRAFLEGPLERYLQLIEASPGRLGARIMEHLRASLRWFSDSEKAAGRSTEWLDRTADAVVRARFSGGSDNDCYMIEVFDGRATHNYRASDDEDS